MVLSIHRSGGRGHTDTHVEGRYGFVLRWNDDMVHYDCYRCYKLSCQIYQHIMYTDYYKPQRYNLLQHKRTRCKLFKRGVER